MNNLSFLYIYLPGRAQQPVSRYILFVLLMLTGISTETYAQISPDFSSNLPIIIIDTENNYIPDEPKIMARMQVIYNGYGEVNSISDTSRHYDGWIEIERRGSSTQQFEKKSYSIAAYGVNLNHKDCMRLVDYIRDYTGIEPERKMGLL